MSSSAPATRFPFIVTQWGSDVTLHLGRALGKALPTMQPEHILLFVLHTDIKHMFWDFLLHIQQISKIY
jgi:hypothetical protein